MNKMNSMTASYKKTLKILLSYVLFVSFFFTTMAISRNANLYQPSNKTRQLEVGILEYFSGPQHPDSLKYIKYSLKKLSEYLPMNVRSMNQNQLLHVGKSISNGSDYAIKALIIYQLIPDDIIDRFIQNNPSTPIILIDQHSKHKHLLFCSIKNKNMGYITGKSVGKHSEFKKIAFVSDYDTPENRLLFTNISKGIKKTNPNIQFIHPKFTGNSLTTDVTCNLANMLYQNKVDLILHNLGKTKVGVKKAAILHGKWELGIKSIQENNNRLYDIKEIKKFTSKELMRCLIQISNNSLEKSRLKIDRINI